VRRLIHRLQVDLPRIGDLWSKPNYPADVGGGSMKKIKIRKLSKLEATKRITPVGR
jgi:hypothetical protein